MSSHDVHQDLQKIDRQIIDLLGERMDLYRIALQEDDEGLGSDHLHESLAEWEEAADEHGWNSGIIAKICRGVIELCKNGASDE